MIIVGVELKRAPDIEKKINLSNQKQYKFIQKTKAEFISDLRRVFASAEFINLQLQDNEILKVAGKEIYGKYDRYTLPTVMPTKDICSLSWICEIPKTPSSMCAHGNPTRIQNSAYLT